MADEIHYPQKGTINCGPCSPGAHCLPLLLSDSNFSAVRHGEFNSASGSADAIALGLASVNPIPTGD